MALRRHDFPAVEGTTVIARGQNQIDEKEPIESPKRRLRLEFSGNLIKHLGLSMYGGAVPALAELVANAWDADAHHVTLRIPLGKPITEDERISIKDDGRGMTWEEVERDYLVIGRNRRYAGEQVTREGRPIMGRKGIGKLAGFGIAKTVEIRTVRNRWLTHFRMNYEDMTSDLAPRARYEPEIIADERIDEKNSTTVILKQLQIKRAIPPKAFRDSLARRFAVLGDSFVVTVNGEVLRKSEMPMPYRFPKKSGTLNEVTIPDFGPVKYWYGFTAKPIEDEDARGLSIYVRGRMASPPSMFGITGGVWNQAALEYLTGEVYADELDKDEDLISTNRQSINWRETQTAALQAWGQKLIRDAARQYDDIKKQQIRDDLLGQLDEGKQATVKSHLAKLPDRIARVANRLIANYHSLAEGKSTAKSLESAIDGIVALSEAAVPIAKQRDALSDIETVITQRRSILDELSVASKLERRRILSQNPWVVLGPWRLAVNDTSVSKLANELRNSYASLSKTVLWVVLFESRHYIVAFGEASTRIEKSLAGLATRLHRHPRVRKTGIIVIGSESRPSVDGVRVTTIDKLIENGVRECEMLLSAVRNELQVGNEPTSP